jgi:hypothetical protein
MRAILLTQLRSAAQRGRRLLRWMGDGAFRERERLRRREWIAFERDHGPLFAPHLSSASGSGAKALVVGMGLTQGIAVELALIKGLELAGFAPVVLAPREPLAHRYYRLAGVERVYGWDEFTRPLRRDEVAAAARSTGTLEELLRVEDAGTRVGRYAASTVFRALRAGSLDLDSPDVRRQVEAYLRSAMRYARAARELVRQINPAIALSLDPGYTPQGELFDACLAEGVDTITWNAAHKSNAIFLRRYTSRNRGMHHASLSDESWRRLREMPWTASHRQALQHELSGAYASGDWYSEVGTQFRASACPSEEVRRRLRLDPAKKTAVIFPHIFWDATFFWGRDVFCNYEEWFVQTVKAACRNDKVQWVIKVHPANLVKNVRDRTSRIPAALAVLRAQVGALPAHVRVIPPESDLSTYSLFEATDYAVTVRGTVGIEAATFGIPVLTAGTGRYDHRGFTIDAETPSEHLDRLASIQEIPRLSESQRELAERFAFGLFILRPWHLSSVTLEYQRDAAATRVSRVLRSTSEGLASAPDLQAFARWVREVRSDDYLDEELMAQAMEQPAAVLEEASDG